MQYIEISAVLRITVAEREIGGHVNQLRTRSLVESAVRGALVREYKSLHAAEVLDVRANITRVVKIDAMPNPVTP